MDVGICSLKFPTGNYKFNKDEMVFTSLKLVIAVILTFEPSRRIFTLLNMRYKPKKHTEPTKWTSSQFLKLWSNTDLEKLVLVSDQIFHIFLLQHFFTDLCMRAVNMCDAWKFLFILCKTHYLCWHHYFHLRHIISWKNYSRQAFLTAALSNRNY